MRYAIYIPLNAKDFTIDLLTLAYGNRQSSINFAPANNSNLLRALKDLMETMCSDQHLEYTECLAVFLN